MDWILIIPKSDFGINPFQHKRKQWIFHVRPRRGNTINLTNLLKHYFKNRQTIRNWYINWIEIKLARFFGTWQNRNWLGSSRFDFWQEHYHIIHWSRYSKLGGIWFSVVWFHLVQSSVQVTTWWWSKSSIEYKHNWRALRSQMGFVSISLKVVRLWGSTSKLYNCFNNNWTLLPNNTYQTFKWD